MERKEIELRGQAAEQGYLYCCDGTWAWLMDKCMFSCNYYSIGGHTVLRYEVLNRCRQMY